jgi:hypothetical protein
MHSYQSTDNLLTEMNAKKRITTPKPEWHRIPERMTRSTRIAEAVKIAREYQKRLDRGEASDELAKRLASKYGFDERTIFRRIAEGRRTMLRKDKEKEIKKFRRDIYYEKQYAHFDDLTKTAGVLANRLKTLLDDKLGPIEGGNIVDGLHFWPSIDETPEKAELRKPVDSDRATDLLHHFNKQYPEMKVRDWKKITRKSRNIRQVRDALSLMARSRNFHPCTRCAVCKALKLV